MVFGEVADVEEEVLARVTGHVNLLGVHADGVAGAGFDAEAAEDAAQEVDGVCLGAFLDGGIRVFLGNDIDALGGAGGGAEHAGGATNGVIGAQHQAVLGAVVG